MQTPPATAQRVQLPLPLLERREMQAKMTTMILAAPTTTVRLHIRLWPMNETTLMKQWLMLPA
jgi:hypothetical protein